MIIESKSVVAVNYSLHVKDEENGIERLIDKSKAGEPLVFMFGMGGMIKGFEDALAGKKQGDKFDFWVAPEEGYGDYYEDDIAEVPLDIFKDKDGKIDYNWLKPGTSIPMRNNEGHTLRGKVLEVGDSVVVMDFNHELAGEDLHFTVEVVGVRGATIEEIAHGHAHGWEGGHHHH
ncbi:MAG: peptidylprolyl isomerase [Bacteroidia bacterium]|nr:peptidylprolyl isomerase [Bacteroidia bacterium]